METSRAVIGLLLSVSGPENGKTRPAQTFVQKPGIIKASKAAGCSDRAGRNYLPGAGKNRLADSSEPSRLKHPASSDEESKKPCRKRQGTEGNTLLKHASLLPISLGRLKDKLIIIGGTKLCQLAKSPKKSGLKGAFFTLGESVHLSPEAGSCFWSHSQQLVPIHRREHRI
jgi:hypothetical protein